jgi:hypothetical protein
MTHSYGTSAVLQELLLVKDTQKSGRRFEVSRDFFRFFLCQILCSNFWLTESFKQVHRQYFITD